MEKIRNETREDEISGNGKNAIDPKNITLSMAAICRDLAEGGDGRRYFGSTLGWSVHFHFCEDFGLIDENGALTDDGKKLGNACGHLPTCRAYMAQEGGRSGYEVAIEKVFGVVKKQVTETVTKRRKKEKTPQVSF